MHTDHTAGEDTPTAALLRECAAKAVDALLAELRRRPIVQPEWLSLQEAAVYCGYSEQQFSDFVKRRIAPPSVLFFRNPVQALCRRRLVRRRRPLPVHEETVTAPWGISNENRISHDQ